MTHEFDGKKYEKASAHQKEWGRKLIAELDLRGSERILDLGCGDGALSAQLADLVPRGEVVGIDASRGMIEAAQSKGRKNLRFLLMDIDDLNFVDEFDVVFSNATLHWIKDHQRLLRNAGRALREAGRLRFNFAGEGNCSHFFSVVREAMSLGEFAAHFAGFDWPWHMPSVEEYAALMEASGMHDGRVWGENADRYFPDAGEMIKWIDQPSLVPFLAHLPDMAKPRFREYVIGRMIEETQQDDGRCFETFRRIDVSARQRPRRRA
ncbi:MAG TPA: methyltransferase domain-containing protein [Bryobacteraceae bacterium]|nr:methyltransferase domain-containing protein [Bryobacteraceae bacterium]